MSGPPPKEVWSVFQSAFKEMHQRMVEMQLQQAQLLAQAAERGGQPGGHAQSKAAFEPQQAGGAAASSARNSAQMMSGFKSQASMRM